MAWCLCECRCHWGPVTVAITQDALPETLESMAFPSLICSSVKDSDSKAHSHVSWLFQEHGKGRLAIAWCVTPLLAHSEVVLQGAMHIIFFLGFMGCTALM